MNTHIYTQYLRFARNGFWALCILLLPTVSLAAESSSFRLSDEFPNFGDNIAKTSGSFTMDNDGTTWFADTTRSSSFILLPSNSFTVTGGSTGGTGGAGSTGSTGGGGGSGATGDANAGTGGGGRRPPVVVIEPTQPEKPTNTGGDLPKDPVIALPEVSPPLAPVRVIPSAEEARHGAAPNEDNPAMNEGVQPVIPRVVSGEPRICKSEKLHGSAFDLVQSCSCNSTIPCCKRISSYLGYLKWTLFILLLVCADLLAIVILLMGKVRRLEGHVYTKSAPRHRTRKKA